MANEIPIDRSHIGYGQICVNTQIPIGLLSNDISPNVKCSSYNRNPNDMLYEVDTQKMRQPYATFYTVS